MHKTFFPFLSGVENQWEVILSVVRTIQASRTAVYHACRITCLSPTKTMWGEGSGTRNAFLISQDVERTKFNFYINSLGR